MVDKVELEIKIGDFVLSNIDDFSMSDDFGAAAVSCDFCVVTNLTDYAKYIDTSKLVTVYFDGIIRFTGAIDKTSITSSDSGMRWRFNCRDLVAQLADHYMDPTTKMSKDDTIISAVKKALDSAGFKFDIEEDDANEANIITGKKIGYRQRAKTFRGKIKEAKKSIEKDLKAQEGEGCFKYIDRICKNDGLICWSNAAGNKLFISTPTFDQEPLYLFVRKMDGQGNNLKQVDVSVDFASQPAFILGEATFTPSAKPSNEAGTPAPGSPQKVPSKSVTNKVICVNEFAGYKRENGKIIEYLDSVARVIASKKSNGANVLESNVELGNSVSGVLFRKNAWNARAVYYKDSSCQTEDQLIYSVKRKMAEAQSKFFSYECSVAGFKNNGAFLANNTVGTIVDERLGIRGDYWVKAVRFSYSKSSGQSTTVTLVPKYCYSI